MPPSTPAERGTAWRTRLASLQGCLEELDLAMQAGQWEQIEQLVPRVERALNELRQQGDATSTDSDALRQALQLAGELQTKALARQQQIEPLLKAWRTSSPADKATP